MKTKISLLLFLIGISAIVYMPIIDAFFLCDDFYFINRVYESQSLGSFLTSTFGQPTVGNFYRPIVELSFYANFVIWGTNPLGYHLTNVLLHGLNSFLVFFIIFLFLGSEAIGSKRRFLVAMLGAILFLVLSRHGESVSWISGRFDIIATFFSLSSFLAYIKLREGGSNWYFIISLLCFALALMSKETSICLPLVLLACEIFYFTNGGICRRRLNWPKKAVLFRLVPFFLILLAYFAVRYIVLGTLVGGYGTEAHLDIDPRAIGASLIHFSIGAFLPPFGFIDDIPPGFIDDIPSYIYFTTAIIFGMAFCVLLVLYLRKKLPRMVAFSVVAFYLSLIPVITMYVSLSDSQGERFTYFPSVFLVMFLTGACYWLLRNRSSLLFAALAVAIVLSSTFLLHSNNNWRDAGNISNSILHDFEQLVISRDGCLENVVLLNLPDNLNGAFIYKSSYGFQDAVNLVFDIDCPNLTIASFHTLRSPTDRCLVTTHNNGTYEIELMNERCGFQNLWPVGSTYETRLYWVRRLSLTEMQVKFKGECLNCSILYYSQGRLLPLTP